MTGEQIAALMTQWHMCKAALHQKKMHDYADGADALGNFRRMHALCQALDVRPGERASDVFLFYILLKIDRICNLLHSGKEARNESVDDTMQDLSVYVDLLRVYLVESDTDKENTDD